MEDYEEGEEKFIEDFQSFDEDEYEEPMLDESGPEKKDYFDDDDD